MRNRKNYSKMTEVYDNPIIEQQEPVNSAEQARFTVIGSGVIGLLTAHALAEQGHDVTVVSHEGKPSMETDSTSAVAVGQFLPWVPPDHAEALLGDVPLEEVTDFSRGFYEELAQNKHETGVMPVRNVEFVSDAKPWPDGLSEAMAASKEHLDEPIHFIDPAGEEVLYDTALTFDTFSINTRKTVAYLAEQAEKRGVKFEQRKITPEELEGLEGIIINATGMGASKLDPSEVVNEFKGHTFVVRPKDGHSAPTEALSVDDLIIVPREDGTVVCGALYIEDPKRPIPEEQEASELLTRLSRLCEESVGLVEGLEADFLENIDVLVHSAGYRVEMASGGIRIAPDAKNTRLLHAYGFGGLGWTVGPHFAKKIASLAHSMHLKYKENSSEA
jgi:D-amino-acid oxidase